MPRTVTGLELMHRRAATMTRRAGDMRPLIKELRKELRDMIKTAWATRTSPMGDVWPPLSSRSRATAGKNGLARDHKLRSSKYQIKIIHSKYYASWQFFGREGMPARNPLPFDMIGGKVKFATRGAAGDWYSEMLMRVFHFLSAEDEE